MFYVYVIKSEKNQSFYKGFTENPITRLVRHNNGETQSTRNCCPWKLVYVEHLPTKRAALIREINLKKATRERIIAMLNSSKNIIHQFAVK